jgi:hypothetical protein
MGQDLAQAYQTVWSSIKFLRRVFDSVVNFNCKWQGYTNPGARSFDRFKTSHLTQLRQSGSTPDDFMRELRICQEFHFPLLTIIPPLLHTHLPRYGSLKHTAHCHIPGLGSWELHLCPTFRRSHS